MSRFPQSASRLRPDLQQVAKVVCDELAHKRCFTKGRSARERKRERERERERASEMRSRSSMISRNLHILRLARAKVTSRPTSLFRSHSRCLSLSPSHFFALARLPGACVERGEAAALTNRKNERSLRQIALAVLFS